MLNKISSQSAETQFNQRIQKVARVIKDESHEF